MKHRQAHKTFHRERGGSAASKSLSFKGFFDVLTEPVRFEVNRLSDSSGEEKLTSNYLLVKIPNVQICPMAKGNNFVSRAEDKSNYQTNFAR